MLKLDTVDPRNNETAGEIQKIRICENFVIVRMQIHIKKTTCSLNIYFQKSVMLLFQPCSSLTAQLSNYKKCFIASHRAHLRTTKSCQTRTKNPAGSPSLCIFILGPASEFHQACKRIPASSIDELCQTVAPHYSIAVHKTKGAPLC